MCKILCSTGALIGRPNNRNFYLLDSLKDKLNCDGFEFMMYDSWYDRVDELSAFLHSLNISIPVVHCEKHIGEKLSAPGSIALALRLFEINCRLAKNLGASKLVLHLYDGLTSDKYFENNLRNYSNLISIAQSYSLDLLTENVVCNCKDPTFRWNQLTEQYGDVHFTFDTKMAAFHNQLELFYSEKFLPFHKNNHIRHYHINDYGGGYMDWQNLKTLPIGKGNIDFDKFFNFVGKSGYRDTFTVEATAFDRNGIVDVSMLNAQFDLVRNMVGKYFA